MMDLSSGKDKLPLLKKNGRIIGLTAIGCFLALFVFGYFFPSSGSCESVGPERAVFNVDPLSLEAVKIWNKASQDVEEVELDSCNTGKRLGAHTWQVTLENC